MFKSNVCHSGNTKIVAGLGRAAAAHPKQLRHLMGFSYQNGPGLMTGTSFHVSNVNLG